MTEQKCAKIVAGEGLKIDNSYIELPTIVFVVYRFLPYDEFENVVVFIFEDDADEFVKKYNELKDGYNYKFEKLELKW